MEVQHVTIAYMMRLAFDHIIRQLVSQTSAAYKGRTNPPLVLELDPSDDLPFKLLKRVGIWMSWKNQLTGDEDVFSGSFVTEVDGARHRIVVSADAHRVILSTTHGGL